MGTHELSSDARNLDFLYQVGTLRHIERAWRQYFGINVATNLEHTIRVAFAALLIARMEKATVDEGVILKMALVHDLAESLTGDLTPVQKRYLKVDEHRAINDMLGGTAFADFIPLIERYEKRECMESKCVKDADMIDVDMEMQELAELGHHMVENWRPGRKQIRDTKLYTDSARQLWDAIQVSRPSAWQDTILEQ